jgi:cysteine dioxygenase
MGAYLGQMTEGIPPELLLGRTVRLRGALRAEELGQVLATSQVNLPLVWRGARFNSTQYVRRVLYRALAFELVLACWLPGQASPIHDHGGSEGAMRIVAGQLHERRYRRSGKELIVTSERRVATGTLLLETANTIHQVENATMGPALSLHLYAPPLLSMNAYSPPPLPGPT